MGNKRFDCLEDFVRHRFGIEVVCRCGHKAVLDQEQVWWTFVRRKWASNYLGAMRVRLRCSKCGDRPERIGPGMR